MNNKLDITISRGTLVKKALPTILSTMFMSVYMLIDGIFVSRFIGTSALSAVNIVMPLIMISVALGTMFAAGGSAIIAKKMGEGKDQEARTNFSMILISAAVIGIVIAAICMVFIHPLIRFLGANDAIYSYCYDYTYTSLLLFPFGMLAMLFQIFFITAGRPGLGMGITVLGGVVTAGLDLLLLGVFKVGIKGAAFAVGMGYAVPALIGFLYFMFNRKGTLYFVKPKPDIQMLLHTCTNGSSEMVTNLSMSIVTILLNNVLMKIAGENGVAAITVILYAQGLLNAAFLGYSTGVSPVISYNYGKQNHKRLQRIYRISKVLIAGTAVAAFAGALIFAKPLVAVFSSPGTAVFNMTVIGLRIFAGCFLFMGFSIFGSAMFTAFSNGKLSALISFLRALVFVVIAILILPRFFGITGVWLAVPAAELLGFFVTGYLQKKYQKKYQYA